MADEDIFSRLEAVNKQRMGSNSNRSMICTVSVNQVVLCVKDVKRLIGLVDVTCYDVCGGVILPTLASIPNSAGVVVIFFCRERVNYHWVGK